MDELTRKLFETFQLFHKLHMSVLLPENLSKNEYLTLMCIERMHNVNTADRRVSISMVAKMLRVTTPAVSRTVSTLEERGILLRENDKNDRRNTYVKLTSQGKVILQQAHTEMNSFFNQMVHNMKQEDIKCLIQYLTDLYENANAMLEQKQKEKQQENKKK